MSHGASAQRLCSRIVAAWLACAVFLAHLSAHAQEPARAREAREWFERGLAASRSGEFAEAARAFERSRELAERPSVLQNLAVALQHLERFSEALSAVERALELMGSESGKARQRLEDMRSELRGQVAEMTI